MARMTAAADPQERPYPERHTDEFRRRRHQTRRLGRRIRVRIAVAAILLLIAEVQLMPVRWWHSSDIAVALGLTELQSAEMDRVYQQMVPASESASIDVMRLTERAALSIRDGDYGSHLLQVTADLVQARDQQCALRRKAFVRAASTLSLGQRARLASLLARRVIID